MRANIKSHQVEDQIARVADAAHSMIDATADAAEDKIVKARQKLRTALDTTKETIGYVQQKASDGAEATDELIREKPYHAIGIAFGLGAIIGYLLTRRD